MTIEIRMTGARYDQIHQDLARPHPFAAERIGFAFARIGSLANEGRLVLLTRYHSIPDDQYIEDETVGARIGSDAMTWAMQAVYHGRPTHEGVFHIHVHPYPGSTGMSKTDRRELPRLMPGFQSVGREAAHGIIILSSDHGAGWVWLPGKKDPIAAHAVTVIGKPLGVFEMGGRH